MFIVKKHVGYELPISVNIDLASAQDLYSLLNAVARNADAPDYMRVFAVKLADDLNKAAM